MNEILAEIQDLSYQFVIDHLDEFDPHEWENNEKSELRRKAFSELGLFLHTRDEHGASSPEIRSFVAERVNDPRYRELLRRYPDLFRQNAFPAIVLKGSGDLDPATERAVDDALESSILWGKERYPNQLVDLLVESRLWGYDDHDRDLTTVLETSNLVHPPDVVTAHTREFYRLTHNVFLPTNFGWDHPDLLDAPLPYDLEPAITGGLLRSMGKGNADAAMELVITGVLQQQLSDRLLKYFLKWLYEEMTNGSHVVAPEIDESEAAKTHSRSPAKEWGPDTSRWARHYHVNLVAGFTTNLLKDQLDSSSYHLDDVSLSSEEFHDILALGRALNHLNSYDLKAAAETLSSIEPRRFEQFPRISRRILGYLEMQQNGDSFGYWVDERRLYEQQAGDGSDFHENLVEPISSQCRKAVANISSGLSALPTE